MKQTTVLGITYTADGGRYAHRTDRRRDLCIMACVFCRDPQFLAWLSAQAGGAIDEAGAKTYILTACRIASRNELDTDPDAALRFHALVREPFLKWKEEQ